jgi:hypothetical protein
MHVMYALNFRCVHVKVCNYTPNVGQLSWLKLELGSYLVGVSQDLLVILRHEVRILLLKIQ